MGSGHRSITFTGAISDGRTREDEHLLITIHASCNSQTYRRKHIDVQSSRKSSRTTNLAIKELIGMKSIQEILISISLFKN